MKQQKERKKNYNSWRTDQRARIAVAPGTPISNKNEIKNHAQKMDSVIKLKRRTNYKLAVAEK